MSFNELKESVKRAFPFTISDELAHEIVFSGSFIEFTSCGETLFQEGDRVKGLYLILNGKAAISIPSREETFWLEPGEMAGLDSFVIQEKQSFKIYSATELLQTLFIDRFCYELLLEIDGFQGFVNYQMAKQIQVYKKALSSSGNLVTR